MKKFLLIPLAVFLAFGICACGEKKDENPSSQSYETVVITKTNAEGEVETEIVTVPRTEVESDRSKSSANGTEQTTSAQQQSSIVTEAWGDDGFTQILPEPKFGKQKSKVLSPTGKLLTVAFSDATYAEVADYLKRVKDAGFTVNISDMSSEDVIMYFADNSDRSYNVGIGFSNGNFTVMILRTAG